VREAGRPTRVFSHNNFGLSLCSSARIGRWPSASRPSQESEHIINYSVCLSVGQPKKLGCTNGARFAKYETAPSSPLQSTSIGEQQGKTNFRTTSSLTGIKPSLATQLRFHYYPGLQRPSRWFKEASSSLDVSTARPYAHHTSREHLIARTTLPRIQSRMIPGISSGRKILYRNEPRYHVYHYCRKKTKTKCKTSKDCMYRTGRVYREPYDSQEKSYDLRERD
jgi:hypothetical protein